MHVCLHVLRDVRSHGAGGYEPPDVDVWNPTQDSGKTVCAVNHWVISLAPNVYILLTVFLAN